MPRRLPLDAGPPACPKHGRRRGGHPPKTLCADCWAEYGFWRHQKDLHQKVVSLGRARGGGQSSKAKGRSACQLVAQMLTVGLGLDEGDVFVKATSQAGVDLHFSPRALKAFPFAPEVKCQEALNIWAALKQADANSQPGRPAVLFFKRAHTELFVALAARHFLALFPNPDGQENAAREGNVGPAARAGRSPEVSAEEDEPRLRGRGGSQPPG